MREGIYISEEYSTLFKSFLHDGFVLIEDFGVVNSSGFRVSTFTACTLKHLMTRYPNMKVYLSKEHTTKGQ